MSAIAMQGPAEGPHLWLHGRTYDLAWYGAVPILATLLFLGAFAVLGPAHFLPVFLVSSVLTGYGHNMVTWLLILPRESRRHYATGTLFWPATLAALTMVPVLMFVDTPYFGWAFAIHNITAFYHITRQHIGMMHVCDGRYVQATGDGDIRGWSAEVRRLIGMVGFTCVLAKLAGPQIMVQLNNLSIPFPIAGIPVALPLLAGAATGAIALHVAWRAWSRGKAGAAFPALHVAMAGGAIFNLVVANLLPNQNFVVTYTMIAAIHNLQYMAFVYTHHHLRARQDEQAEDAFSRLARERRWASWLALPLGLAIAFTAVVMLAPVAVQAGIALWFMMIHYLVDGAIWKRKNYPNMGRFGSARVEVPLAAPGLPEVA